MENDILTKQEKQQGLQIEGFIDGRGYKTALEGMGMHIESLRWAYNHREVQDLKTLKTILEESCLFLKIFNRIHKEMLNKYSADSIKELCLDYDLTEEKKDIIKLFGKVYRPLKHYVESKQVSSSV